LITRNCYMKACIKFLGMHRIITKIDRLDMPINTDTSVSDALEYAKERFPDLPIEKGMVIMTVNQEVSTPDRILRDGDTVEFLPLIAGG